MSQDLSGINKPRAASLGQGVGATAARAVGQAAGSAPDRQSPNPHDDKDWDNFAPQAPTLLIVAPTLTNDDTPLILSISALQAMLEDPTASLDLSENDRAKWLSRLVLLRSKGWSQAAWHAGEPLPQLLVRLWAEAGLADNGLANI